MGKLKIYYLQHVPFEDAANIAVWAERAGHSLERIRLHTREQFPDPDELDWLIVMGGLMNIYEYDNYPWLLRERQFIHEVIRKNKAVLGICLGAQLIADVLGAKVRRNRHSEIGWHEVELTPRGEKSEYFDDFPARFTPFHWHGDTFAIPTGTKKLCKSQATPNQAFQFGKKVLALQFHLEYSKKSIQKMIKNCSFELTDGPYIQKPEQLIEPEKIETNTRLLFSLLDVMESKIRQPVTS